MELVSIDVGKKNFAVYVERLSEKDLEKLQELKEKYQSLPKSIQKRKLGSGMSEELKSIVQDVCKTGERVFTDVENLRDTEFDVYDLKTRVNILNYLNNKKGYFQNSKFVRIEQQFFKSWGSNQKKSGTEANIDAIKIGELVFTWFLMTFPEMNVEYFFAGNKTLVLGAPYGQSKQERKGWTVQKAREDYEMKNDVAMIELYNLKDKIFRKRLGKQEIIDKYIAEYPDGLDCKHLAVKLVTERQKLDDVADAYAQAQAFKVKQFVEPPIVKKYYKSKAQKPKATPKTKPKTQPKKPKSQTPILSMIMEDELQ